MAFLKHYIFLKQTKNQATSFLFLLEMSVITRALHLLYLQNLQFLSSSCTHKLLGPVALELMVQEALAIISEWSSRLKDSACRGNYGGPLPFHFVLFCCIHLATLPSMRQAILW